MFYGMKYCGNLTNGKMISHNTLLSKPWVTLYVFIFLYEILCIKFSTRWFYVKIRVVIYGCSGSWIKKIQRFLQTSLAQCIHTMKANAHNTSIHATYSILTHDLHCDISHEMLVGPVKLCFIHNFYKSKHPTNIWW